MSGITGIFRRDGRDVDLDDINKMTKILDHRGPDGSKTWCEGPVAFGHQMLHTTPESLYETLPFEYEQSGLIITADARIDNRKELSHKLNIKDAEFVPDSFFLLKSYDKWGEKCTKELLGDFAFAIYDKNKETLFCARDHMGVKPFYYYFSDDSFFFATEIKSLFTIPEVPYKLDELKIAFHLMRSPIDKLHTFYKDIFSLSAAHSLVIDSFDNKITQYWKLNPNLKTIFDSESDYVSVFQEIFTEAVSCRLRSAFPLGFELSGGLDSSSVVCVAKKILSENSSESIKTFSLVFNEFPQVDESYYIKKVIDIGGIEPNFLFGDRVSPLEEIETISWYLEQPFYIPNTTLLWNNYKNMRKNHIRILLGGDGGDQVLSHGNHYIHDLVASRQWKKFIKELRGVSKRKNQNFYHNLIKELIFPVIPLHFKKLLKKISLFNGINKSYNREYLINSNFADNLGGEENLRELAGISMIISNVSDTARNHHYYLMDKTSHQYPLEVQDRIASPFSLELRHPFYDKRLIEFCYSIPDDIKFKFGWDRYMLRVGMENILPKEIQWRSSKKSFTPVLERNLLLLEKKNLENYVLTENKKISEYVDLSNVNHIYKKYKSKTQGNYSSYLWQLITLSIWLNDHFPLGFDDVT